MDHLSSYFLLTNYLEHATEWDGPSADRAIHRTIATYRTKDRYSESKG